MRNENLRVGSLDILRCLAVLLVLGHHLHDMHEDLSPIAYRFMQGWFQIGWVGVDLFFVLSGFLVSGLLFREQRRHQTVHIGRFLVRRGLKIYPPLYFMLAVGVVLRLWSGRDVPVSEVLSDIFFLQCYVRAFFFHTWTLGVEEHFYIGIAILSAILVRRHPNDKDPFRSIPAVFFTIAAAILAIRCFAAERRPFDAYTHAFPTHMRADSLFFGVFLAYYYHYHRAATKAFMERFRFPLIALAGILLSPLFYFDRNATPWFYSFGFTMIYLAMGAVLIATVEWTPRSPRPLRWLGSLLASIGVYSYSIYLWHMSVRAYAPRIVKAILGRNLPFWLEFSVYIFGSIGVGIVLAKLVEIPTLHLRDRLFPSRSTTPSVELETASADAVATPVEICSGQNGSGLGLENSSAKPPALPSGEAVDAGKSIVD